MVEAKKPKVTDAVTMGAFVSKKSQKLEIKDAKEQSYLPLFQINHLGTHRKGKLLAVTEIQNQSFTF